MVTSSPVAVIATPPPNSFPETVQVSTGFHPAADTTHTPGADTFVLVAILAVASVPPTRSRLRRRRGLPTGQR
jgi:hypothetical protein